MVVQFSIDHIANTPRDTDNVLCVFVAFTITMILMMTMIIMVVMMI